MREDRAVLSTARSTARSTAARLFCGLAIVVIPLVGGCTKAVSGIPTPERSSGASGSGPAAATPLEPPPPAPPPDPAAVPPGAAEPAAAGSGPPADGCRVVVSGQGSIRLYGGGRVRTVADVHSFACRSDALVTIEAVDATGARLAPEGGAPVAVAVGATAAVGPYRVTTVSVDGAAAEFRVLPGG